MRKETVLDVTIPLWLFVKVIFDISDLIPDFIHTVGDTWN